MIFSGRVIGCAFTVLNTLGAGFLEKDYESALWLSCVLPGSQSRLELKRVALAL